MIPPPRFLFRPFPFFLTFFISVFIFPLPLPLIIALLSCFHLLIFISSPFPLFLASFFNILLVCLEKKFKRIKWRRESTFDRDYNHKREGLVRASQVLMRRSEPGKKGRRDIKSGIRRHFRCSQLCLKVKARVSRVLMRVYLSSWYREKVRLPPRARKYSQKCPQLI